MEIERKWLVKELPNLEGKESIRYERYFIYNKNGIELRIQKKGDKFQIERKVLKTELSREEEKLVITEEEFNVLKSLTTLSIIRDSYIIQNSPEISLKIYHDQFEGLVRVEVEFENEDEAKKFEPLEWFGNEITESDLGKDSKLINLTNEKFKELIKL